MLFTKKNWFFLLLILSTAFISLTIMTNLASNPRTTRTRAAGNSSYEFQSSGITLTFLKTKNNPIQTKDNFNTLIILKNNSETLIPLTINYTAPNDFVAKVRRAIYELDGSRVCTDVDCSITLVPGSTLEGTIYMQANQVGISTQKVSVDVGGEFIYDTDEIQVANLRKLK